MRRFLVLALSILGIAAVALVFLGHPSLNTAALLPTLPFFLATTHSTLTDQTDTSCEIPSQLLTGAGGATSGAGVDMQGWEGVVFTINLGVLTGSGALDAWAQSSPTSVTCTDMANITGSAITQVLTAKQNNVVQVSVYRPTNRYVRLQVNQTVNNVQCAVTATRFRRTGLNPGANVGQPAQSPSEIKAVVQN